MKRKLNMKTRKPPKIKTHNFQGMLSSSKTMLNFFETLTRVARTDSAVLIRGDSGTGKELAAKAIHNLSHRGSHQFNAVNCAMLTPELANSELFGHQKGAFTGAVTDHKGFFEQSHNGTLFLDEVAELPFSAQPRLLRVLQERNITPVGSTKSKKINVRLLSATHKSLRKETKEGNFREDLMYRIRVVPLFLPKLTERGKDIELLLWKFIEEFNSFSDRQVTEITEDAYNAIMSYLWPGNIRELRNNVENAFAIGEGSVLTLSDLTPELRGEGPPGEDLPDDIQLSYQKEERQKVIKALNDAKGNKSDAAEILDISRSTLWRKMKDMGIS